MTSDTTAINQDAAVQKMFAKMRQTRLERDAAVQPAKAALHRLVEVCRHKTGQGYKLRALLFSLWNGKPTSLLELVGLDWAIRQDLNLVLLAFGHEEFFYDAVSESFDLAGLLEWFTEEVEAA